MEDFRKAFECAGSRLQIEEIGKQALLSPEGPETLYALTGDPDQRIAWHALWTCVKLSRKQPHLFFGKRKEMMQKAMQATHQGMKRLWIDMLLQQPILQPLQTDFFDFCLQGMCSPQEAPAVQALCASNLPTRCASPSPNCCPNWKQYWRTWKTHSILPPLARHARIP